MKRLLTLLTLLLIAYLYLNGQIIVTSPQFPTENDLVTITYDATLGTAGLKDYKGDVYAHTGVITNKSASLSDWKYTSTWGSNVAKYKMTSIGNNKWTLQITPDIRRYYGVPSGETIQKMAFVFRSSDNKLEGKGDDGADIFASIYESGLLLRFDRPTSLIYSIGETVDLRLSSSIASDITLYVDDTEIATSKASTTLNIHLLAKANMCSKVLHRSMVSK